MLDNGLIGSDSRPRQKQGPFVSLGLAKSDRARGDLFGGDVIYTILQHTREEFAVIHPNCPGDTVAVS